MNAKVGAYNKEERTMVIEFDKALNLPERLVEGMLGGRRLMYHGARFNFKKMIEVSIAAIKGSLKEPLGDEANAHTD